MMLTQGSVSVLQYTGLWMPFPLPEMDFVVKITWNDVINVRAPGLSSCSAPAYQPNVQVELLFAAAAKRWLSLCTCCAKIAFRS